MRNNISKQILLIFFVFAFIVSCSSEKKISEQKKIIPAERVIVKSEAKRRKVKFFSANGVLTVNSPQINSKFSFTVEFKKPDSLRITAYGPFGMDIASLLLTKENFFYFDALANVLYRGNEKNKIISKLFKVPISSDELINLLIGKANFETVLRVNPDYYALENGFYHFIFNKSDYIKEFYISEKNLLLEKYKITSLGKGELVNINFTGFKKVNGESGLFPFKIFVKSRLNKSDIEIKYSSVKINEPINDLKLILPNDFEIKEF